MHEYFFKFFQVLLKRVSMPLSSDSVAASQNPSFWKRPLPYPP
jgi:hypothetical protein